MNEVNKIQNIQFLRNAVLYTSYTEALSGLQETAQSDKVLDGEILIARYTEDNGATIKVILGAVTVEGGEHYLDAIDEQRWLGGTNTIVSRVFIPIADALEASSDEDGELTKILAGLTVKEEDGQTIVAPRAITLDNDIFDIKTILDEEFVTLGIEIVETSATSENILTEYQLVDKHGVPFGDSIKIYKDQSLANVKFDNQTLTFTYNLSDGTTKDVDVDVSAFLHEQEASDGLQVIDHKISVKTTNEKHITVSEEGVGLGENAVTYSEFGTNNERKTIQLRNHDSLSGIGANCENGQPNGYEGGENLENKGFNLAMLSKWNVADFGSTGVHMNLNTKDNVTINDSDIVAVLKKFKYNGEERRTLQLNNYDSISGIGANCEEGQPNGYEGGKNLEGQGFNLVMLSKWNVADFGSSKIHLNLNSLEGKVTINDGEVVATEKYVNDHSATLDEQKADKFTVVSESEGLVVTDREGDSVIKIRLDLIDGGTWE